MKRPTPAQASREIDAKSKDLMKEFFTHVRDFQAIYPSEHDPRKIFEAWAIQKIAALQYTVLKLGDEINKLAAHIQRN
jgi:hypothetical protein